MFGVIIFYEQCYSAQWQPAGSSVNDLDVELKDSEDELIVPEAFQRFNVVYQFLWSLPISIFRTLLSMNSLL